LRTKRPNERFLRQKTPYEGFSNAAKALGAHQNALPEGQKEPSTHFKILAEKNMDGFLKA